MAPLARARLLPVATAVAAALAAAGCGSGGSAAPLASDEPALVEFRDGGVGVSGVFPRGWHRARSLGGLLEPREVLALASYPLRGGASAGECAPSTAREDMRPGGTFVWLLEYRPLRGEVWANLPRERFPPRPARFELDRRDLGENLSCFLGPGYSASFRAADRPFQLLVAFGGEPAAAQLEAVEAILDSLEFEELAPPPPDPYAGWPLINDNPGDSLRVPPDWAAAAATFRLGDVLRPRPLFFASNVPLPALRRRLVAHVDALPGPLPPATALEAFPAAGVLVWVLEEEQGGASAEFPQIEPGWPRRSGFRPRPTKTAPELRRHRAGGSFRGYRFSVWVVAGPDASGVDVELAFRSAASLAVSGCFRDAVDDCDDESR